MQSWAATWPLVGMGGRLGEVALRGIKAEHGHQLWSQAGVNLQVTVKCSIVNYFPLHRANLCLANPCLFCYHSR